MDAAEAGSSLGQTRHIDRASARPPLPRWVPPVCGVMFGAAVVLQGPNGGMSGLTAPLIGLALALGAYALIVAIRARQGAPRRPGSAAPWITTVVAAGALSTSSLNSSNTSELRWLYVASGAVVAGIVWYRLQRKAR
ncbi:hypothetical protein ABZY02_27075 [Streptomyces sp. NPDC006649]|uniref:hypothetical protein n=1 Tax=Streptomyces sp. NPDC006649 TaxID=3156896 RepID=UPI0033B91037